MDEKRYIFETVEIIDDNGESRVVDVITDKEECYSYENLCDIAVLLNGKEATIQRLEKENDNCRNDYRELFSNYVAVEEKNEQLKKEDLLFFQQVFDILMKYQHLFNREMADEVLEDLGIELTEWFE